MSYKRIGKIVFGCSVTYEGGAYYLSDMKTHSGDDVDPFLFSYNVLTTSFVKGLLWPYHVPLFIFNYSQRGIIPQYKKDCVFFTEAYLDEHDMLVDQLLKEKK